VVEPLDESECLQLIGAGRIGRLAYTGRYGHRHPDRAWLARQAVRQGGPATRFLDTEAALPERCPGQDRADAAQRALEQPGEVAVRQALGDVARDVGLAFG